MSVAAAATTAAAGRTLSPPVSPTAPRRALSSWSDLSARRPLPLRFVLFPSRRPSHALCPCLVVSIAGYDILRILDPEHREPFVSLGALFLAAGITPAEGLLRFELRRDRLDYDLSLAGLEPFDEIWAPLAVARRVATELDVLEPLSNLLSWSTRHIWSLDEGDAGLVHNWRVPAAFLDPGSYSTGSLLRTSIPVVEPLPRGQQVRTLVSATQRAEVRGAAAIPFSSAGPSAAKQLPATAALDGEARNAQTLLRWSVRYHESLNSALDVGAARRGAESPQKRALPPWDSGEPDNSLDKAPCAPSEIPALLGVLCHLAFGTSPSLHGGLTLCNGLLTISSRELTRVSASDDSLRGNDGSGASSPLDAPAERAAARVVQAKLHLALAHLLAVLSAHKRSGGANTMVSASPPSSANGAAAPAPAARSPVAKVRGEDNFTPLPRRRRSSASNDEVGGGGTETRLARVEAGVARTESALRHVTSLLEEQAAQAARSSALGLDTELPPFDAAKQAEVTANVVSSEALALLFIVLIVSILWTRT